MPPTRRLLLVDDNEDMVTMLQTTLARRGFTCETATSAAEALERAGSASFDAALIDLVMPQQDGVELAEQLRQRQPGMILCLLTGYTQSPLLAAAKKKGISVFTKPVAIGDLADFLDAELR